MWYAASTADVFHSTSLTGLLFCRRVVIPYFFLKLELEWGQYFISGKRGKGVEGAVAPCSC